MSLQGYDVIIRKVVEDGRVIFPEAFCLTEQDRVAALEEGKKLESVERLKQTNASKFFSQYNNDPLDEERLEFKRTWFKKYELTPELSARLQTIPVVISIDPAFRLHQYNDYTGVVVTKTDSGNNVFVLEARQIKVNPDDLVKEIFRLVDRYVYVKNVLVETVTSQIMLMNLLRAEMKRRGKFFLITEVKPANNESKTIHIRSLIPHYANGRIFHAPGLNALEEQLLEFPKGAHDDIIDALAYQINFWGTTGEATKPVETIEGSWDWWKKKQRRGPTILGGIFNDLKRRR